MRHLRFADQARADLREIAANSRRTWGARQTAAYMSELRSRMRRLPEGPFLGVSHPEIDDNLRSVPSGRHLIFYEVTVDQITILRVFHDSMDYSAHLNPRP